MADDPISQIEIRPIVAAHMIADLRSFRLAAEALHTTQPSLSRHVQAIEASLDLPLFRRGWSGAELTPGGEIAIRHFRTVVALVDEAEAALFPPGTPHPPLRTNLRMRQLAAIGAVVRNGGVSAAANALGCLQPEISRSLSQTASHLGLNLFRRVRTGMEPLPAAMILARLHGKICFELRQIPPQIGEAAGRIAGRVSIGMLPFSGQGLIARAFAELTNRYSHIRLVGVPGSYNSLVEALRRREIDRIVGTLRGDALAGGLIETFLYNEEFSIVARRDHPMQTQARSIADLGATRWVVAPHGTPVRRFFDMVFAEIGAAPPIQTCEMLSFASAEQMLVESNSVGMLTYSADGLRTLRPDLARLDIALPNPVAPIGITRLAADDPDPAVAEFDRVLTALVHGAGVLHRPCLVLP